MCDNETRFDIIIVGAGVAGASLAARLGQCTEFRIAVIERDWNEPDRIVGEFLQPGGVHALNQLGLSSCLDGIDAVTTAGYAVFLNGEAVHFQYPTVAGKPNTGRAFHHGRFIQNLRRSVRECAKTVTCISGAVVGLLENEPQDHVCGVRYRRVLANGSVSDELHELESKLTIICDGPASSLRRVVAKALAPCVRSHFVALLLKNVNHELPFPNHGHVILSDQCNPILMYPIGDSENHCRVLVDLDDEPLPNVANGDMANFLLRSILPEVPAAVQPQFKAAVETGRIRCMPNRILAGKPYGLRGAFLLGDAFNCRHPLTGGGMTVALSDVYIMSLLISRISIEELSDPAAMHKLFQEFLVRRRPLAKSINVLASALYSVFAAKDSSAMPAIREACFDYFKQGGENVRGPMGLLSGLSPSVPVLVKHFFGVALHGMKSVLLPIPTPFGLLKASHMLVAACSVIVPLLWRL
eukprot:ANDGO_04421.mRNA.1 Squalene epoxidase 1